MSEHQPQTAEKSKDYERPNQDADRDHIIASNIHEMTGGKGASPEVVDKFYELLGEQATSFENPKNPEKPEDDSPIEPESSDTPDDAEPSPKDVGDGGAEARQAEREQEARATVEEVLDESKDSDKEDDPISDESGFAGNDKDTEVQTNPEKTHEFIAISEKRQSILGRIEEADKITNKKKRLKILEEIAKENMREHDDSVKDVDKFTFPDLAIEAVTRMQNSHFHTGFQKWRLGRTKKVGITNSLHNELLAQISSSNPDSMIGVEAAKAIDMPWLKHETLLKRGQHALGKLKGLQEDVAASHDDEAAMNEYLADLNKYTHIAEIAKLEIRGWHSWKYDHIFDASIATYSVGPDYLDVISNFHFHKKQKALYDMAVIEKNENIADRITYPWLRKKALNEIRILKASD